MTTSRIFTILRNRADAAEASGRKIDLQPTQLRWILDLISTGRDNRELAAFRSLLDHHDTCSVCREDGIRWCDEEKVFQTILNYEAARSNNPLR